MQSTWIDHIPAIWFEPETPSTARKLVIFLTGLSGTKESVAPQLQDLARAGCVALRFDPWEHGERTRLTGGEIIERTFGNFRRHMWVTIGQTALDALRVIDWAIHTLGVDGGDVRMGGLSMGGDISVAAAGLDRRITRVGAVVATPDWKRPGMIDLRSPEKTPLPTGAPDAYALAFYERFNPITHLEQYAHAPAIRFVNGAADDHVPPEASLRFKAALSELYPAAGENVTVDLLPGLDHIGVGQHADLWWPGLAGWLAG